MRFPEGQGEDGVAVVVPVHHQPRPLDGAVQPQHWEGGDA